MLRAMRRLLPFMLLFACVAGFAHAQQPTITLTPAQVLAGAPELVRIDTHGATAVTGEWLGRKLQFIRGLRGTWFALCGVDVEQPEGSSTLTLHLTTHHGRATDLVRTIPIAAAPYRTSSLAVAPEYVEPGPEAQSRIAADQKTKDAVFATSAPHALWRGSFRPPVASPQTESFGTRRIFNGTLASIHRGLDFRARVGTPVRASNSGVVAFAGPLYYEGNCVILDHGLGLFTVSMHLSRINVRPGQHVAKGQRLGLSGATGRATGPHLHWSVRWQGASLDPAKLLKLNLNQVH